MWRRKRVLGDLDRDIHEHLVMETQNNIERGMSSREAHFAAVRKFGNVTRVKEDTREVWSFIWLEQLWQDVRFASRMQRKTPGFTLAAILTLALGIGANVGAFAVVRGVLLNPLPYRIPNNSCAFTMTTSLNSRDVGMSVPELQDLRDKAGVFQDISALAAADVNLTGVDRPERIQFQVTSANYFTMLAAQPQLGRVLYAK